MRKIVLHFCFVLLIANFGRLFPAQLGQDMFVGAMITNIEGEGVKEALESLYPVVSEDLQGDIDAKVDEKGLSFTPKPAGGYEFSSDDPKQQISSELAQLAYNAYEAIKDKSEYLDAWNSHFIKAAQGEQTAIATSS